MPMPSKPINQTQPCGRRILRDEIINIRPTRKCEKPKTRLANSAGLGTKRRGLWSTYISNSQTAVRPRMGMKHHFKTLKQSATTSSDPVQRNNQRKIDRRRMKAVIDQALGDVECVHALTRLSFISEDDFVHRRRGEGLFIIRSETVRNVARVEDRGLGCFAQTVVTVGENISERA